MSVEEEPLNRLYLSRYIFTLHALEDIRLPKYKGATLRGLLGYGLRKVMCIFRNSQCEQCSLRLRCIYSMFMESPLPEDHPFKNKYRRAPHPYIIIPPLTRKDRNITKGESFSFEIVLIGKANDHLPYIIYSISNMGKHGLGIKRGKYKLLLVESKGIDGDKRVVYSSDDGIIRCENHEINFEKYLKSDLNCTKICFIFETPLRIKHNGRLIKSVPFKVLIQRLAERAFLLSHFYCGSDMVDFESFSRGAEAVRTVDEDVRWIDWGRYSTRQKTDMKLGGIVGKITYSGDLKRFIPLLKIGEYIHVGKATTFGLGKYKMKLIE